MESELVNEGKDDGGKLKSLREMTESNSETSSSNNSEIIPESKREKISGNSDNKSQKSSIISNFNKNKKNIY